MPEIIHTGSRTDKLWGKIRHGLIVQSGKNCLKKIGIEITPYYWVQEAVFDITPPAIRGECTGFSSGFLVESDMAVVAKQVPGDTEQELIAHLRSGKKCFGVRCNGTIAAVMWINLHECHFKPARVQLKRNEAYLYNMYTFDRFRGKNIAPYLRYRCYMTLRALGRNTFYSVTEFFNHSAVRYKEKLGAVNLKLVLYVNLFNMVSWSMTLRQYNNAYHIAFVPARLKARTEPRN